jgi:hypothetical protein
VVDVGDDREVTDLHAVVSFGLSRRGSRARESLILCEAGASDKGRGAASAPPGSCACCERDGGNSSGRGMRAATMRGMWAEYRRQFVLTQVFIVFICVVLIWHYGKTWLDTLVALVVMELFAFAGAAWTARLRRKWNAKDDSLPLQR